MQFVHTSADRTGQAVRVDKFMLACLVVSVILNILLLKHKAPLGGLRELSEISTLNGKERDCASVACPDIFRPDPPITCGHSVYQPFQADTRFRRRHPHDMQELTSMLYGGDARVGEPYIGYDNPFGRTVDMNYAWTQVNERILDQASSMIGGRLRFFVEVGSFMGKSSVLIADWLRRQETHVVPSGRGHASLLCIDTWTGDLGMTLGHIYKDKLAKRNGMPTLYHTWLLNIIASNNTQRVLPLMAPSLLAAKALSFSRLAADIVYLDSAHEMQETFLELAAFWPVVRPGGILIGETSTGRL